MFELALLAAASFQSATFRDNTCWRWERPYPASWVATQIDREQYRCGDPRRDRRASPRDFDRAQFASESAGRNQGTDLAGVYYCYDQSASDCYYEDGRRRGTIGHGTAGPIYGRVNDIPPVAPNRAATQAMATSVASSGSALQPLPAGTRTYAEDLNARRTEASAPVRTAGAVSLVRSETEGSLREALDSIVAIDSSSWLWNRYDRGSMRNVSLSGTGSNRVAYGEYTYNGGMGAWVRVRFSGANINCIEFHDYSGICRPIGQATSRERLSAAWAESWNSAGSSTGGYEGARRRVCLDAAGGDHNAANDCR